MYLYAIVSMGDKTCKIYTYFLLPALGLRSCPSLKTPPKEIVSRGFQAVFGYLHRLQMGSVECWRTKLMLVGLGGAGKTRCGTGCHGNHISFLESYKCNVMYNGLTLPRPYVAASITSCHVTYYKSITECSSHAITQVYISNNLSTVREKRSRLTSTCN